MMCVIYGRQNCEVTVLHTATQNIPDKYIEEAKRNGIRLEYVFRAKGMWINKIPKARSAYYYFCCRKRIIELGKFDLCQIMMVDAFVCDVIAKCKRMYSKIVLTYFGSDILRMNSRMKTMQAKAIRIACLINIANAHMKQEFVKLFGEEHNDKLCTIMFPVPNIERIHWREWQGTGKIIVMCGYNATIQQQHLAIIRAINTLPARVKKLIKLKFLMTYGDTTGEYTNNVKCALQKIQVESEVITEFMDENAMLESINHTDVFLHCLTTDGFSATMRELLCAGVVMIKGSWLKYSELENMHVHYHDVENFEQLPQIVCGVIDHYEEERIKCKGNVEKIYEISSVAAIRRAYDELGIYEG